MATENVIEMNEHICLVRIGMNNYRFNVEVVRDCLQREENCFWLIFTSHRNEHIDKRNGKFHIN